MYGGEIHASCMLFAFSMNSAPSSCFSSSVISGSFEDSDEEIIENFENYQIYLDTHEIDGIEDEILEKLNKKFEGKK